jgi:hypothetical protein
MHGALFVKLQLVTRARFTTDGFAIFLDPAEDLLPIIPRSQEDLKKYINTILSYDLLSGEKFHRFKALIDLANAKEWSWNDEVHLELFEEIQEATQTIFTENGAFHVTQGKFLEEPRRIVRRRTHY